MTVLAIVFQHWRVAAFVGVCVAGLGLYQLGHHDARQQAAVAAAEAAAKAIQHREKIDGKIGGMDAYGLCLELGGLRDECAQLRRVESNPR